MGQAKEISIRQKIALAHKQGRSYTELANEYGINFNTVRTICLRYEAEGERGLVPRYGNCGRSIKDDDELAFRFVRLVKSLHPLWGISYILGRIRQDYPNLQLQSLRHYQRRVQSKTGKIPKAQVPRITPADTARVAHETWQIDAKECIELGDGSGACYLNISDEKTAAVLKAKVFPLGRICKVRVADIRILLLELFQQWGMPQSIRTDNGEPFGVPTRDVIPILSLWLLAWGIKPILNRPRRPQDNATVECNQGTTSRWAEVDNCPNVEILQTRLDEVAVFQRNAYPVRRLKNKTRTEVFKDLQTISRPFDQATFDEQHAYQFLAKAVMPRKVSSSGATSIYNKPFQVGLPFKGNIVFVKFDPNAVGWSILDRNQNLIKTIPDPRFSRENLFNLTVCQ